MPNEWKKDDVDFDPVLDDWLGERTRHLDDAIRKTRTLHALVGVRVEFNCEVDRYPHTLVQAGERGTIVAFDNDTIAVRLDEHHDGLREWDNEIMWSGDMDNRDDFFADVSVPASQQKRRVAMIVHPEEGGFVRDLLVTERHTFARLRELRRFACAFDDGIYVASDGWMLETWSAMYFAHKGHVLNYTDDEILAARVALDMVASFSVRRTYEIQTMCGRHTRPTIHTARAPF